MNKFETRRLSLLRIVENYGRGGQAKVAKILGIDASYLSRMLYPEGKKGKKNIGDDMIDIISSRFPNWLSNPDEASFDADINTTFIPSYETGGSMGAGLILRDQPGIITNMQVNGDWLRQNLRFYSSPSNLCVVTGFGDSMEPMYKSGDPLLIDRGVNVVDHDGIFFFRIGNEGFVKRLQRIPMGSGMVIRAKSENKEYDSWDITEEMDFEVFGKVLKVWASRDF